MTDEPPCLVRMPDGNYCAQGSRGRNHIPREECFAIGGIPCERPEHHHTYDPTVAQPPPPPPPPPPDPLPVDLPCDKGCYTFTDTVPRRHAEELHETLAATEVFRSRADLDLRRAEQAVLHAYSQRAQGKDPMPMVPPSSLVPTVLDLIQRDPHQWSKRPCPTCSYVTKLTGIPFGCEVLNRG